MGYSSEIKLILKNQNINGGPFWSRKDGDIHAPHGQSSIDNLLVLGELGATISDYKELGKAVEFVFGYQMENGSFKYSLSGSKLPCMTARILASFGRLGVQNNIKLDLGYQNLLTSQWPDGGWRCNTVKIGKSALTDASNPGTTLYVLDAFRFRENSEEEKKLLDEGVEFLLKHWESKVPTGPCTFGIGSRFLLIEYPFLRYNVFYYLYILSFYSKAQRDNRFSEVYNYVETKIQSDKVLIDNPHKSWRSYSFAKKNEVSEIASKRWLEIKMNAGK